MVRILDQASRLNDPRQMQGTLSDINGVMDIAGIARVAHEAVRAYIAALGQDAPPSWEEAPKWMHDATHAAVAARIEEPEAPPSAQHDAWLADKKAAGWRYGPVKDPEAKTHPLMVPYEELPASERRKDALIQAVVDALLADIA